MSCGYHGICLYQVQVNSSLFILYREGTADEKRGSRPCGTDILVERDTQKT